MQFKGTAQQRYNFAIQHLLAAARFARLCFQVEATNSGKPFGPFYDEITSYATAAVFSSVAALEANINEIFADAQDGLISFGSIDSTLLNEIWELIEAKQILEKYQFALLIQGRGRMSKGEQEFQFADTLITARNALVHFKPEWHQQQKAHEKISRNLKGKFQLSPFLDENAPIFPMRCMTHGFADWAIRSSLEFAGRFAHESGTPNKFDRFLDRLKTIPDPDRGSKSNLDETRILLHPKRSAF
jgi:hypothetical protein